MSLIFVDGRFARSEWKDLRGLVLGICRNNVRGYIKPAEYSSAIVPFSRTGSEDINEYPSGSDSGSARSDEHGIDDDGLKKFKDRNHWKGKHVIIYKKGAAVEEIAKRRIVFPMSTSSVGGFVVGEENAGIVMADLLTPSGKILGDLYSAYVGTMSGAILKPAEYSSAIVPFSRTGSEDINEYPSGSDSGSARSDEHGIDDDGLKKFKDRNHWKGKHVIIYKKGAAVEEIAKRRIVFPMSTSSVGGFVVGEENAGIVVLRLMETVDPMVISQELPNFSSDEPHLCRWPICSLRVEENGKILGDLYSAYADADFARDAVPRRRKRAYFSTKRKLRTEEEKVTIRLKKKAKKKLLDANIKEDMVEGCDCTQRCCQTWRLEEVKELRREIYGVKFDKKLDLIYQKINQST
ncbi:hypothetical protein R1sor_018288 [Riccia sorocarpa]|uniref:Uncharacterized protein n=1 Tax=Riccia sorocarpa TaxID=122646 RepID=A0ABD3I9P9_9MARC